MNEAGKVAVKINDYTIILIDQVRDKSDAKETFLRRWHEFQEWNDKHADPYFNQ